MTTTLFLAVGAGLIMLLLLILYFRIPAFIALLIATIVIGLLVGMNPEAIMETVQKGMGSTLGYVATIVGLGAMFGALLEISGGSQIIANTLIKRFGIAKAPWALLCSGFIIAIPVFFDVAFIILIPVVYALQRITQKSLLLYAMPLLAGLAVTHAFIPPTPGPVAVAEILGASLGWVIVWGGVVGLPVAVLAGIVFGRFISKRIFVPQPHALETEQISERPKNIPKMGTIVSIILIPIVLILTATFIKSGTLGTYSPLLVKSLSFLGHPFTALIVANLLAWYFLGIRLQHSKITLLKVCSKSMAPAGTIILLTGAGGVLKQMLVDINIGGMLAETWVDQKQSVFVLAFVAAALVRILQGSSTVAMITTAGLMAPLLPTLHLTPQALGLLVISIASGSSIFSHVNDSGFWLVSQYLGISEKNTFRSWTMMTTVLGVTGFLFTLLISLLL